MKKAILGILWILVGALLPQVGRSETLKYWGDGERSDFAIEVTGTTATLYLAKKPTNEPLTDVEPELEPFQDGAENVKFSKTAAPGVYQATFDPKIVWDGQILFTLNDEMEATAVQESDSHQGHGDEHAGHDHGHGGLAKKSLPEGIVLPIGVGVVGLLLGFLGARFILGRRRELGDAEVFVGELPAKKRGVKKKSFLGKIALWFAAFFLGAALGQDHAWAGAGHSHSGPEASAGGNGTDVKLPKKSQFLVGVRTMETKLTPINASAGTYGHIIAHPQLDTSVNAPSAGTVQLAKGVAWGDQVKKGQMIATLETIGDVELRAPISGRLMDLKIASGKRVEAGEALFRIVDTSKVWIDAELFEKDLQKIGSAKEALISVSGSSDVIRGRVLAARTPIDENSLTAKVFVEVDNTADVLRLGSYVGVSFLDPKSEKTALIIPKDAVLFRGADRIVFVQTEPEKFVAKPVVTAEHPDPHFLIVEGGLAENERVVVKGNYQLLVGLN